MAFLFLSSLFNLCKKSKIKNIDLNSLNAITNSIHQFKVKDLQGNTFDFSKLKGKKIIVVNTASKCGLTPQYKKLQQLYDTYKNQNFIIIGFPANNFLSQEPGSNEDIASFCSKNYGVTFPMMSKVSVKGKNKHKLYQFLTQKAINGVLDSKVKWNFQKYLIDENGFVVGVIPPSTSPLDKKVVNWIIKKR